MPEIMDVLAGLVCLLIDVLNYQLVGRFATKKLTETDSRDDLQSRADEGSFDVSYQEGQDRNLFVQEVKVSIH